LLDAAGRRPWRRVPQVEESDVSDVAFVLATVGILPVLALAVRGVEKP
jgi:hypothetical protein